MQAVNDVPTTKGPLRHISTGRDGGLGLTVILEADKYDDLLAPQAGKFAIEHSKLANGCLSGFGNNVYPVKRETGESIEDMASLQGDNVVWRKDFQITPSI
jgi:hypothetical protein